MNMLTELVIFLDKYKSTFFIYHRVIFRHIIYAKPGILFFFLFVNILMQNIFVLKTDNFKANKTFNVTDSQ